MEKNYESVSSNPSVKIYFVFRVQREVGLEDLRNIFLSKTCTSQKLFKSLTVFPLPLEVSYGWSAEHSYKKLCSGINN